MGWESSPVGTRELVAALRGRRPYKVLLEVSARAGRPFAQLDALFWDQAKRRRVEVALAAALGDALGTPVAPPRVLVGIPKAGQWGMDVHGSVNRPPLAQRPPMTSGEA